MEFAGEPEPMGRAIAIAFLGVVLSIAFVLLQLSTRRSAAAPAPVRRQPMFETRDDGSVYAVSLQLTQFEKRLMEEEERSRKLLDELEGMRKERDDLGKEVQGLQEEVRRLRRQVTESREAPAPAPTPANAPANGPATPVIPPTGTTPAGPGTPVPPGG
jgi:hypothetical protein